MRIDIPHIDVPEQILIEDGPQYLELLPDRIVYTYSGTFKEKDEDKGVSNDRKRKYVYTVKKEHLVGTVLNRKWGSDEKPYWRIDLGVYGLVDTYICVEHYKKAVEINEALLKYIFSK